MARETKAVKWALAVAIAIVAVACGSAAAAAVPVFWVNVHARLTPVAGTSAAGRFTGTLLVAVGTDPAEPPDQIPPLSRSQLVWKLKLPALRGPISASLRLRATKDAAPVATVLCARCSKTANGSLNLTVPQGLRIVESGAVVVVRARSARLRGVLKVSPRIVAS